MFIVFSLILLFSTALASASENLPSIFINGVRSQTDDSFVMKNSTVYITSEKAENIFGIKSSLDTENSVYNFSNKLRNVTYDYNTGSVNVKDNSSFLYKVIPNAFPSYIENGKVYLGLRMVCESLGYEIEYREKITAVNIKLTDHINGLFNDYGTAISYKGNKYGLIGENGETVLRYAYEEISNFDNPLIYKLTQNHRCGLADSKGDMITQIAYNEIRYMSPDEIHIRQGRKWGMCDIKGTIIVPVLYEEVVYCSNLVAMVKIASRWHILNCKTGEISHKFYDEVYKLTTGIQTDNAQIMGYYVCRNDKWGYVDSFGKTIIDVKYDALDKFDERGRARFILKDKFGIIDCGGQIIIPAAYDYLGMFGSLSVTEAKVGNKYGLVDDKFNPVTPFDYDYIYSFNNGSTTVAFKNGYFGLIGLNGENITPFEYTYMEDFKNGLALAYKNGYGYINAVGHEVISTVHTEVKQGTSGSVFLKLNDKWALYSQTGENLTGYKYMTAGSFSNGLSAVSEVTSSGEKYGYVNDSGDILIECQYDIALDFKYGKAIVRKGNYSGIIDVSGKTLIPFVYSGFNSSYDYNVIAAADGATGKWGLISFKNEKLSEFKYDYIFEFENGYAYTLKDHLYGMIDAKGNEVLKPIYKTKEAAFTKFEKL